MSIATHAKFRTTPRSIVIASALCVAPFIACSAGGGDVNGGGGKPAGGVDSGVGTSDYGSGDDGGTGSNPGDSGPTVHVDGGAVASEVTTIFTIVMENHDYAEVVGDATDAPFINSLIDNYGLATNYMDSGTHPSLPNYLDMTSGDTVYFGIVDLDPTSAPFFPSADDNLGNQMTGASIKWRAYAEDMGTACNLVSASPYAAKHEPFLYYSNIQSGDCADTNVDYSSFATDLAAGTYKYMYIAPNLTDDGHDPVDFLGNASDPVGSLTTSDTWLKTEVGKIMDTDVYKNGGVIFITWDEGEGRNGDSKDQIPMIVVSPLIKSPGFKSATAYSHKSYLATVEDLLGLARLTTVASEPNMLEFFK